MDGVLVDDLKGGGILMETRSIVVNSVSILLQGSDVLGEELEAARLAFRGTLSDVVISDLVLFRVLDGIRPGAVNIGKVFFLGEESTVWNNDNTLGTVGSVTVEVVAFKFVYELLESLHKEIFDEIHNKGVTSEVLAFKLGTNSLEGFGEEIPQLEALRTD